MHSKTDIVTVTYNSSKKIKKFLSALVVNKKNINQVVIIENNSKDKKETKRICQTFSNRINIAYIHNDNVGFGKSCNIGGRMTKGNYILFLNPDTELQKDSLKILIEHLEENKADIIGGKAVNYEGQPHGSVVRNPNLFIGLFEFSNLGKLFKISKANKLFYYKDVNIISTKDDQVVDVVSGAYLLITNFAFKKLNGFDEGFFMYLEDVDLCKRANDLNLKVIYCPHSEILHEGGASSKNKYRIHSQAWFDSRKYYYKKHFGLLANLVIQPLYIIEEFMLKKLRHI